MKFNQNQIKLFNRNINALNNTVLKENLKQIKSSKFKLILGKDNLDINLKNTSDNTFLYENAIDELNSMLIFIMTNIYFILYCTFMVLEMEFYLKLYCKIKIISILLFLKKI